MKITKSSNLLKFIAIFVFLTLLGACSKSDPKIEPEPNPDISEGMFNRLFSFLVLYIVIL